MEQNSPAEGVMEALEDCLILPAEARQSLLEGALYELKLDNEALDGQRWEGKSILSMCKGLKLID